MFPKGYFSFVITKHCKHIQWKYSGKWDTLPIAEILSGKNVGAWVSMDFT